MMSLISDSKSKLNPDSHRDRTERWSPEGKGAEIGDKMAEGSRKSKLLVIE